MMKLDKSGYIGFSPPVLGCYDRCNVLEFNEVGLSLITRPFPRDLCCCILRTRQLPARENPETVITVSRRQDSLTGESVEQNPPAYLPGIEPRGGDVCYLNSAVSARKYS
ncbi:MAG: hypothetical protein R6U93_02685 [Dehalococcoidia bacterium]